MTTSRRILQVGSHATLRPIHGGQLRSHHIGRVLEAAGHTVRGIATTAQQDHDIVNDRECILNILSARQWKGAVAGGLFADYFLASAVQDDPSLFAEFFRVAAAAEPEIILLEHPWMWPVARLIPEVKTGKARVIYDSQNVEAQLKRKLLQNTKLEPTAVLEAEALIPLVDSLEREVVSSVDAVTACTEDDAQIYRGWGARRIVIAGNGSSRRLPTGIRHPLPSLLPANCRYAFMVGSEHPPNMTGFENLVLPCLASLRPSQRVVVAGGVGDWLRRRLDELNLSLALERRLITLGRVGDLTLAALLENASCIILPIEYGGGSNVKTAEALLSNRRIVASPASMRGFSTYHNLPGVTVADGPVAFGLAVRQALKDNLPSQRSPDSVAALTWDATLSPLVGLIDELCE